MDTLDGLNRRGSPPRIIVKPKLLGQEDGDGARGRKGKAKKDTAPSSKKKKEPAPCEPRLVPLPPQALSKDQVRKTDVILGREGTDKKCYADTLAVWWQKYEAAAHNEKRDICRQVIVEMFGKGMRFLVKVEDGSRHGFYEIEPQDSMKILKKVIRALRAEVVRHISHLTQEEMVQRQHWLEQARAQPTRKVDLQKSNVVTPPSQKSSSASSSEEKLSQAAVRSKTPKGFKVSVPQVQLTSTPMKVVSLPSYPPPPSRPPRGDKIVVPPPPPPPPPVLRMHSFASNNPDDNNYNNGQETPFSPLIPSAINWGTSDIAGYICDTERNGNSKPQSKSSASPDTVLPPSLVPQQRQRSGSIGIAMSSNFFASKAAACDEVAALASELKQQHQQQPPKMQLNSSVSFDFALVFDDDVMSQFPVEEELENNKAFPPLFTCHQSSMFSFTGSNPTDWNDVTHFDALPPPPSLKPATSNRRLSLLDDEPMRVFQSEVSPSNSCSLNNNNNKATIGRMPVFDGTVVDSEPTPTASAFTAPPLSPMFPPTQLQPATSVTPLLFDNDDADHSKRAAAAASYASMSSPSTSSRVSFRDIFSDTEQPHPQQPPFLDATKVVAPSSAFRHPETMPMRSCAAKRKISDVFDEVEEEYQTMRLHLDASMAKLEEDEKVLKDWEQHNQALWDHLIQVQPDFAKMPRGGGGGGGYLSPGQEERAVILQPQTPPRPTKRAKPPPPPSKRHRASGRAATTTAHQSLKKQQEQSSAEYDECAWEEV